MHFGLFLSHFPIPLYFKKFISSFISVRGKWRCQSHQTFFVTDAPDKSARVCVLFKRSLLCEGKAMSPPLSYNPLGGYDLTRKH